MSKTLRKILTASSALLMVAGIGATAGNTNVNARHRHARIHRVYRHRRARRHARRRARRNGWHKVSHHKIGDNSEWWFHTHYVKLCYSVRVKDMSDKGVPEVEDYSIGSKVLPKGRVVRGFFSPTVPGGFAITSGKGVSRNTHYQKSHDAWWNVPRSNTNWISEVK